MKDRIKKIRKELDLTQQKFADKIGMKQNTIAQYEMGRTIPSDAIIFSICREFNVSEEWLRNGTGEMFLPVNRNRDIARLTKQLLDEESTSFKNRFVSMLANLSVEEWGFLEQKAKELCGIDNDTDNSKTE